MSGLFVIVQPLGASAVGQAENRKEVNIAICTSFHCTQKHIEGCKHLSSRLRIKGCILRSIDREKVSQRLTLLVEKEPHIFVARSLVPALCAHYNYPNSKRAGSRNKSDLQSSSNGKRILAQLLGLSIFDLRPKLRSSLPLTHLRRSSVRLAVLLFYYPSPRL
jgi:hypothetical protein